MPAHASPMSSTTRNATRIDEAIVTFFTAPNSYTAEDLVEIAAHGSPVVLDLLLRRALALGARLAEPGEFTQRAFLAGRSTSPRLKLSATSSTRRRSPRPAWPPARWAERSAIACSL